jgi:hypothetical protein
MFHFTSPAYMAVQAQKIETMNSRPAAVGEIVAAVATQHG